MFRVAGSRYGVVSFQSTSKSGIFFICTAVRLSNVACLSGVKYRSHLSTLGRGIFYPKLYKYADYVYMYIWVYHQVHVSCLYSFSIFLTHAYPPKFCLHNNTVMYTCTPCTFTLLTFPLMSILIYIIVDP